MNNTKYPKVLIFGQGFNTTTGGGVTLINLFKGWPKEKIASVVTNYQKVITNEVCSKNYGLIRWKWPISFLMKSKKNKSGLYKESTNFVQNTIVTEIINKKNNNAEKIIGLLDSLGISPFLHREKLPKEFIKWVQEFNPDIIYTQLGDVKVAVMVYKLCILLNKPVALHIMDDWPTTIYKKGLFALYNRRRIGIYFKLLLEISVSQIGISDAMCLEYEKRYKKKFVPFHNTVETKIWSKYQKNNWEITEHIKILYIGRFAQVTSNSILDFVEIINELNNKGYTINFNIVTQNFNNSLKEKIEKNPNIKLFPPVPNNNIPELISTADILFLPLDFDEDALEYIRYSIPTKATEYMISGVPILIYAPKNIAVTNYALKYKWAYLVNVRNKIFLKKALIEIIENSHLRMELGQNAKLLAEEKHNSFILRDKFRETLLQGVL